jgi:hypothetical protein
MHTKLLYITIFCLLIIQACKRDNTDSGCPSYSTNYKTLTLEAINQTPYFTNPAFDTISFASDKGDTVTFVKTKTDSTWHCESDNSNADCPKEKANCYQVLHNTYSTTKGVGTFNLIYNYKSFYYGLFSIEYFFNDLHFIVCECVIDDKTYKNYKSTMNVSGTTYVNNFFEYNELNQDNIGIAYFNKTYGLFYLVDKSNNLTWRIIKK